MAERAYTQFLYSLEKKPVNLYATVDFNDSSAPALKQWNVPFLGGGGSYTTAASTGFKGVKSVARTAQGKYTFTLTDPYVRLLEVGVTFKAIDLVTSPKALNCFVLSDTLTTQGGGTIVLGFTATANSTTLVDLGANDRVLFTFLLSDSVA